MAKMVCNMKYLWRVESNFLQEKKQRSKIYIRNSKLSNGQRGLYTV